MWSSRSSAGPAGMSGRIGGCVAVVAAISAAVVGLRARAGEAKPAGPAALALGAEIFNREWLPDDPRSHGGDGLGPVYNDTSCVACHNAGGSGGAGSASKNIEILSASSLPEIPFGRTEAVHRTPPRTLPQLHAGFLRSRTAVLHRFGTDPNYEAWRSKAFTQPARPTAVAPTTAGIEGAAGAVARDPLPLDHNPRTGVVPATEDRVGPEALADARIAEIRQAVLASHPELLRESVLVEAFLVARSQRNPTPLFGLGLIDAIPDPAIEAMERREAMQTPETKGRASRLKDGRIGRLGWKGQTASTEDFVLNACAVELGLEVPGHAQAAIPQAPKYRPPGLDLDAEECAALVAYVRHLPRPVERRSSSPAEARVIAAGKATFGAVGCANCHAPKLGDVAGIYSDLLLHDMGDSLGDDGSYDPGDPDDPDSPPFPEDGHVAGKKPEPTAAQVLAARARRGAGTREWRTPPLWGFRDSGPYLHDGRAETLEQAIALHGGQGEASARRFFELPPKERLQVEVFLKSLVAPPPVRLADRGE